MSQLVESKLHNGWYGFLGLDDLSLELAFSLVRNGFKVQAFEKCEALISEILKLGGIECGSPKEAGKDVVALIVLTSQVDQIKDATFGLQKDIVLIFRSTILPSHIQNLKTYFTEDCKKASIVDIYATKGVSDDLNGKIMIASSGESDAILKALPILSAMCEKLYVFEGEVGAGSKVEKVKELLESIHLVASLEAISLGTKAGIHPWIIYDIISNAAGNSWVFKNHVPKLMKMSLGATNNHFVSSILQKLLDILDLAKSLTFPLPFLAVAHQQLMLGNVGDNGALAELVRSWARPVRFSTEELLLNAEKGGYAVGAFNVYNLEGVEAVVAAADEQQSSAILQIHPSALKQGGLPLIACCISAAEQACVPISVHFDHGTSKQDLVTAVELAS